VAVAPTKRGIALVAAGLLVAVVPSIVTVRLWPLWLLAVAATAGAMALDAVLCPRRRDLDVDVAAPGTLPIGEPGEAVVHLGCSGRRGRVAAALLDVAPPLAPADGVSVELADAGAGRLRGRATVPLVPERRGTAVIERLWLRLPGPLGLMERTVVVPVDRPIEIHPNIARVRRAALSFADRRTYLAGLKIERYVGDGTDFEALREFVPGFDHRSIDWKASARHRRLLCREFRAERDHQVVVALDTGRLMAEPIGAGPVLAPRLDHAVHTGLVLAYVALRSGDRVGLYAFDERPRKFVAPRGGVGRFPGLLSAASGLEYSSAETNFTLGLTELSSRLHRRSLVVVLTDFVDSITAELMAQNLTRLARRHLVMFVALRDPRLERIARAEPASLMDVERSVVAAGLERERGRVLARLRRRGVSAFDLPPSRVEPRVLNRYLEIKRKELIA